MELSGTYLTGQMQKISQASDFFQLNGLCNYGTLLPMDIFIQHELEIVKLMNACAVAAKRRIRDRSIENVPGMKAVHALRRELEAVWGITLTRQQDVRHTRVIGYVYNKVDRVEKLTIKGDFVQNLIKLHTANTATAKNEEYVRQNEHLLAQLHIDYTGVFVEIES